MPDKPDTAADARVRAHMIGAPGAAPPATPPVLARIGKWLRLAVQRRR